MALTKLTNQSIAGITALPSAVAVDLSSVNADITALALREATNEASAAFNLPNQFIETFTDDTNLGTQTTGDRVNGYWGTIYGGWAVDTNTALDTSLIAHYPWDNSDDDVKDTNELTAQGSPTYSTSIKKLGTHSLELNANTERFSYTSGTPSWGSPSAMSMATWVYWNSTSGTYSMIFDGYPTSPSFMFAINDGDDKPTTYDTNGGWHTTNTAISKNTWVHLGFTLTTTTKQWYINGALDHTTTGTYLLGTAHSANNIGARSDNTHGYGGYLDQTLFWNKELVAQEVTDLYNGGSGDVYTTPSVSATGNFVSTATVANASVSKVGIVITYKNNAGTNTLNTDIVAQVSADGGSNYSTVTLAAAGTFSTGVLQAVANDVSVTAGTSIQYKISFANQSSGVKEARITGVSLIY